MLELLGCGRIVVEYHRGILCYTDLEIMIRASWGMIGIEGTDLRLCRMSREQLCIRGEIREIKLTRREVRGTVEPDPGHRSR